MMKVTVSVMVAILLVFLPAAALGHPHEPPPDAPPPGDWPHNGFEYREDLFLNYSGYMPEMGFRPDLHPPYISFGAFEISFEKGNITDDFDLAMEDWNIIPEPMERSIRYNTSIMLRGTGIPGMNITQLDLDFKPGISEGGRRFNYNITLKDNLTMDRVLIKWKCDIDRQFMEDEFNKNMSDWGWKARPEWSSFDSDDGRELARMHWRNTARFQTETGERSDPVNSTQIISEEDLVLEVTMNIGSGVQMVESGGYLEFLDDLFILVGIDGDSDSFLKTHLVSILIGATAAVIVITVTGSMVARIKVPSDPDRELDYRQSRYYRKD